MTIAIGRGDFVPLDRQLFGMNLGEALGALARRRWPHHTAKQAARAWGLDDTTAANLLRGHASERTVAKAAKAGRWSLWMALGEAVLGESYDQHLQTLIAEAEDARQQVERRRAHVARLEEIAALSGRVDLEPDGVPGGQLDGRARRRGNGVGASEG